MFGLFAKKKKSISPEWVQRKLEENKYTPDMAQLCRFQTQLVFLADEYQKGHPKNDLIKDHSCYLCKAESIAPFVVWKKQLGDESYPVPMKAESFKRPSWQLPRKGDAGAVRGELHAVIPHKVIPLLDKARMNGVQFVRERFHFMVDYRVRSFSQREGWHLSEMKREFIEAWMYVGVPEYWQWDQQPLSELKAPRMFKPNNDTIPPYYKFTLKEYDD